MRASSLVLSAAAIVAAGVLPGGAAAQSISSPYRFIERKQELGPIFGTMWVDRGRFGFGPGDGPVMGARWGVELSGPLSLEGVATFLDGTRDVIHPGRVEGDRKIAEADQLLSMVEARLKFSIVGARSWHGLSPFLVAGGGIAFDLAGASPADGPLEPEDRFEFGSSFVGTLGIGTRWFMTERLALRTDGLFSLWEIPTPVGFAERGFEGVEENEWVRGLQASVSLLYRW